jgi:hypothetical protein
MPLRLAEEPFLFKTQLSLILLTGLKASNVAQLKEHLQTVPESSVYYHTHNFLQRHHFLIPEPPNDFAYWSTNVLNEERLGEALTAIDTVRLGSLKDLRRALVSTMDSFLEKNSVLREAPPGSEFYFMKVILFNFSTVYQARDLLEFVDCLKKVSIHSLYYHMFEGPLRTSRPVNDFSFWLKDLGETLLAKKIAKLDPYTYTLEELRSCIIRLVEKRIREGINASAG